MKKVFSLALSALLVVPALASAETEVNAKLSTLGLGAEVILPAYNTVDARFGLNTFHRSVTRAYTSGGAVTNLTGNLNLQSVEALADWHPFDGAFRLSGGLIYNNNSFSLTAAPGSGTFNVHGIPTQIGAGQSVNANVDFNKVAPYIGFGFGSSPKKSGLSFTSDIGLMYQGTPRTSVTSNVTGTTAADIAKANADLSSSLHRFNLYPVVSVGIGYAF